MKKRTLFVAQVILLCLCGLFFLTTVLQFFGNANPLASFDQKKAVYNNLEAYDPSLGRLNSLKKIEQYCDSVYQESILAGTTGDFQKIYTDVVSNVVRSRFYHGYSYYSMSENYVGVLLSKISISGLNALVIPDDILKHPFAACSQQSIVMMEILKNKGIDTRKIIFSGKKFGGHFAFEVFYSGSWHFHDPNMEPDKTVLASYGRPGIEFLAHNPDVLLRAYNKRSREEIMDIFPAYYYGPVNKFPAPKAIVFQKVTQALSYTLWIVFLIGFMLTRYMYLRIGRKVPVRSMTPVRRIHEIPAAVHYPDYKVSGK